MKTKIIITSASVVLIVALIFSFSIKNNQSIAYVDLSQVYNEFDMKKELEANLLKTQNARKLVLDSMELHMNTLANRIRSSNSKTEQEEGYTMFERIRTSYSEKKENFDSDNANTLDAYNKQIWKQLNQYVKDFGKENKYEFILGGDGSGSVMYAADCKEITTEIKEYVNNRYHGSTK